jgi:hypothetical protein
MARCSPTVRFPGWCDGVAPTPKAPDEFGERPPPIPSTLRGRLPTPPANRPRTRRVREVAA